MLCCTVQKKTTKGINLDGDRLVGFTGGTIKRQGNIPDHMRIQQSTISPVKKQTLMKAPGSSKIMGKEKTESNSAIEIIYSIL